MHTPGKAPPVYRPLPLVTQKVAAPVRTAPPVYRPNNSLQLRLAAPPPYRPPALAVNRILPGIIQLAKKGANPLKAKAALERQTAASSGPVPLATKFGALETVLAVQDYKFATPFKGSNAVDVTCQLDTGQGKHDDKFGGVKEARKKGGGSKVPDGFDYAKSAQDVVIDVLLAGKLAQVAAKGAGELLHFAIQATEQSDGLHYEISAAWEAKPGGGFHILCLYHCYPG